MSNVINRYKAGQKKSVWGRAAQVMEILSKSQYASIVVLQRCPGLEILFQMEGNMLACYRAQQKSHHHYFLFFCENDMQKSPFPLK